jgi:peroxiredoxin
LAIDLCGVARLEKPIKMNTILVGSAVPNVAFGYLDGAEIRSVTALDVFSKHRAVVVGVPGAFTPICTTQHIPEFIQNAESLRKSGYTKLICVAPNDPFVLAEWARMLDPQKTLTFLSDGNLHFCRALGLISVNETLFLGARSERYLLIVQNGIINRVRVEPNILKLSCTRPSDALEVAEV